MLRNFIFAVLVGFVVVLSGCHSGLSYQTEVRKITIKSEPYNAKVYQINSADKHETFLGLTPVIDQPVNIVKSFSSSPDKQTYDYMTSKVGMADIRIEKQGYAPYTGNLATSKDRTLSHRIELEQQR